MAIVVDMQWSDEEEIGITEGSASVPFVIMGTASSLEARSALYADLVSRGMDQTYHGLMRMNVSLKRQAPFIFFATVKYSSLQDKIKFTFDCVAEKVKKTRSLETIANINVDNVEELGWDGRDFGTLVNVSKDRVEGVDVYDPESPNKFSVQWSQKYDTLSAGYIGVAKSMKATVNDSIIAFTYKGQHLIFERGTLLFPGPTFEDSKDDGCSISLKFEESVNSVSIKIGDVDGTGSNSFTGTGDTTNGSAVIQSIDAQQIEWMVPGMGVSGGGIPLGSTIIAVGETSITISNNCTATDTDVEISFFYNFISKEGWHYIWVSTIKKKDPVALIDVERPKDVHIERFYEYSDFTQLEIFDRFDGFQEDLAEELEDLEDDEITAGLSLNNPYGE